MCFLGVSREALEPMSLLGRSNVGFSKRFCLRNKDMNLPKLNDKYAGLSPWVICRILSGTSRCSSQFTQHDIIVSWIWNEDR
jgi:hypothetical protein